MKNLSVFLSLAWVAVSPACSLLGGENSYAGGDGSAENPYQIGEPCQLIYMSQHPEDWDQHFVLTADIDLADYTFTTALIAPDTNNRNNVCEFEGIAFTGVFDGNGHAVSNLTSNAPVIKPDPNRPCYSNRFEDTTSIGVSKGDMFIVPNLIFSGVSKGDMFIVPNLIFSGVSKGDMAVAPNRLYSGGFTGNDYLGLFGQIEGPSAQVKNLGLKNVHIAGAVHCYYLGGLCGRNRAGSISNCYATGSVTGRNDWLGGLCGSNEGTITNCYATTSISGGNGSEHLGGLCGANSGSIANCYATASLIGINGATYVGGLCGSNKGSISNCYSIGSALGESWAQYVGGLCGENCGSINDCYSTCPVTGMGGSGRLGGLCGENRGSIDNCYSTGSVTGGNDIKLIGGLCGANHGDINNCYSTGPVTGDTTVGGLCGSNSGSINISYSTSSITGTYGSDCLGGLCGYSSGPIAYCYAIGSVAGGDWSKFLGGLCGLNRGNISKCYATGSVSGKDWANRLGGLCGENQGDIDSCYSTGSVSAKDRAKYHGGLCGRNDGGSISNCYFLDTFGPANDLRTPLAGPNMKLQSSFVGWDFVGDSNGSEDHWQLAMDGYDYPRLTWQFASSADFLYPGAVDHYDLMALMNDWLRTDSRCCDIAPRPTGDGIVNCLDYAALAEHWLEAGQ